MPSYAFYPSATRSPSPASENGSPPRCVIAKLPSDADARAYARALLERYGVALVDIWDGERDVATIKRPSPRRAWLTVIGVRWRLPGMGWPRQPC